MPKKRNAPKRELLPTQGGWDDQLNAALGKKSSLSELDRLRSAGARASERELLTAAELGSAQAVRWTLSELPAPEGEEARSLRAEALWEALARGVSSPAKTAALSSALGLPRKLAAFERELAGRALREAAASSGKSLAALLDAIEPLQPRSPGCSETDYVSAAAGRLDRLRMILSHPKHGPAVGAAWRSGALSEAVRIAGVSSISGESVPGELEILKELSGPSGALRQKLNWEPALKTAVIYEREQSARWMLASSEGAITPAVARRVARFAVAAGGFQGAHWLTGWASAMEESEALAESAKPAARKSGRARRM